MRRSLTLPLVAITLLLALPAPADAQATGVRCKSVRAGGYSATHVFVDFMPCSSARAKLRRWLPRGRLPRKENGWYCYRLGGVVHACSYPGKRNADRSFTFWLRRARPAAAPIRECGDMAHRLAYNITTRKVQCVEARRVVRRWNNTAARRGGDGRIRGLYCNYRNIGYEAGDIRCIGSRGRVVRWQTYS
jgi:hypothetical protein